uniref:myocardial zonula adherens protein-like n=1 Tax=Pristiophorus japonicus TaxID=55135 RepID=UPI00398E5EDA
MFQYKTATTCTIADTSEPVRRGNIRRVRLTLHAEGNSNSAQDETKSKGKTEMVEKTNTGNSRKRNGYRHLKSNSTDPPILYLSHGLGSEISSHSRVYGVVQRADANKAEVVVYEWSVNQLKEEMNYIKEVRQSLEKVRQRMFGEFNEMKERIQQLTTEMKVSEVRQASLQREVSSNSSTLEQYSQMNSSLTSVTIDLQRSLLDSAVDANKRREEMEDLRKSYHQSLEQMKEKDQQIQDAQSENQILKLKIESSQEANASAMRDMTRKLYNQYEAKLKEAEQEHQAEKEAIQARINQALKELEEANQKALAAEQKIAERERRIEELDQLIARMVEEHHLLQQRLQEKEQQLQQFRHRDEPDSRPTQRSQKLEEEAASLRERIRHLDNMVDCQQRKVKQMIEEIEILKSKIKQKDITIEDLMERISFLEAENKELQDKLDYMMSLDRQRTVETREQMVSCDIPIRKFIQSLPDKGKRITEFIAKLEAAIAQHEEVERAAELLSAVKLEFQKKPRERTPEEEVFSNENATLPLTTGQIIGNKSKDCDEVKRERYVLSKVDVEGITNEESSKFYDKNQELSHKRRKVLEKEQATSGSYTAKRATNSENSLYSVDSQRTTSVKQEKNNPTRPHNTASDLEADFVTKTDLLSDRLDAVTLKDNGHSKVCHKMQEEPTLSSNVKFNDNPFQTLHHQVKKTPHYVDILEQRAKNPVVKRAQFKANHPISGFPGSSPDHSPGRSALKLSPAERRLRDRKHLDDITAARLPPLYHTPAQLLSLEESGELQISQKQKYESTQASLAADKLTQRLNIKIMNFNPECASATTYREYRDQGDNNSSEEDLT